MEYVKYLVYGRMCKYLVCNDNHPPDGAVIMDACHTHLSQDPDMQQWFLERLVCTEHGDKLRGEALLAQYRRL